MTYVNQVIEQAAALGGKVADLVQPALDLREYADWLDEQLSQRRKAGERERAQIINAGVAGVALDEPARIALLDQTPAKIAGTSDWKFQSDTAEAIVSMVSVARRDADKAVADAAPKIFEQLQALVAGVVAESVKLTASLPSTVVDERSAYTESRGGAHHFQSWLRLGELLRTWLAVHALVRTMQLAGWVDGPAHQGEDGARMWQRFRYPNRLRRGFWDQPGELQLGMAAAAGAEPGLWAFDAEPFKSVKRRQMHAQIGPVPMENVPDTLQPATV